MTPTARYISEENCLQEQPRMERPYNYGLINEMMQKDFLVGVSKGAIEDVNRYNAHLASLRRIPCDPSCKGLWRDQQKVVEGVDYEVRNYPIPAMLPTDPKFIAFPLVPVKSEDELWEEVEKLITVNSNWQIPEIIRVVKLLKSKYSLTKR